MIETILDFIRGSGFGHMSFGSIIMIAIGCLFIFLAIKKGFEPLLLVPIGFGILIGNIPYDSRELSLSVFDGPVSQNDLTYYATDDAVTIDGITYEAWTELPNTSKVRDLLHEEDSPIVRVHWEEMLGYSGDTAEKGVRDIDGGHQVLVLEKSENNRYPIVVTEERQDPFRASVLWYLYRGVAWGIFPPLIFLGVGALTDFGPLLANPKTILLGAAAQIGIFGALVMSILFGFDLQEAGSIGIIGGADGPTAIFTCTQLAPHLLGPVALAAYSYMALVPIIQPPIMKLLTTKAERKIRMAPPKDVSQTTRILFPIVGFLLTAFIANGALPLLGMLFFGNLLRECHVTDRLSNTAQTTLIDVVTILLGLTVGAKTQAANFLTLDTIGIFILGILAFAIATASGVLFAKLMNVFSKEKINPLIGAAGVSAVPMAARVCHKLGQEEDPQNFLLMHAMGPNVAGVIGSAVAAGVLLSGLK